MFKYSTYFLGFRLFFLCHYYTVYNSPVILSFSESVSGHLQFFIAGCST